jgi:stringent starvation protein B
MPPTRLPRKKDVALALLEKSSMYVHLDPRGERVLVPNWFRKQPQLVLQVGLNMAIPIPDLHVDDDGLSCTLSFNRSPHHCVVPWSSVYALVGEDGRGMVWPDDVPPEVASQMQQKPAAPKPKLAAVGQAPAPSDSGAAAPLAAPAKAATPAPAPVAEMKPAAKKAASRAGSAKGRSAEPKAKAADTKAAEAKADKTAAAATKKKRTRRKATNAETELKPVPEAREEKPVVGAAAGAKPKRELPPYLRVIK